MSTEFRNLNQARFYLKLYIDNNRNLKIIKGIPLSEINRFDVWACVFEKEPEAFREIYIKEYYDIFLKYQDSNIKNKCVSMLAGTMLMNIVEWNIPFTIDDAIQILIDCYGKEILEDVKSEVENIKKIREDIVKSYKNPDTEWINKPQLLIDKITHYQTT